MKMRWRTNRKPQLGDTYRRVNFAFIPVKLKNGFTIWLEFYISVYEYVEAADETLTGRSISGWVCCRNVQKYDGT